jgi:O-antigen ligase
MDTRNSFIVFLISLVFIPQFFVFPFFLNPDNEAKALFFCFFCFLLITLFSFQKFSFFLPDLFLFLTLLIPVFSAFFSPYYGYSFLFSLSILAIIFFRHLSGNLFEGSVELRFLFLRTFSFFVLISALLGLYQYFSFFLCGKSTEPLIPYFLPPDTSSRVTGIYGQPNFTALLLLVGLLVYLYLYLHDKEYQTTRLYWLQYLPFLTVAIVFFLTGSRAGFLAFGLTFLLLCWLVARRRYLISEPCQRRRFCFLLGVLISAFCIAYGLNRIMLVPGIREFGAAGVSTDTRFVLWTAAALIFIDHPWLGVGIENFKFYLPKYASSAHDLLSFVEYEAMGYTSWAHNEFLQLTCEGGIVVLVALFLAMGCLFYPLFMYARGQRNWTPFKLYSHLFLVPFVIQSMFSWPMRYSPLVILFFAFGGLLLSQYHGKSIAVTVFWRNVVRVLALCGLVVTLFISSQEMRMGHLAKAIKDNMVQGSFPEFELLVMEPYSEYPLLLNVLPRYIHTAIREKDVVFAGKILPHLERLTEVQGAYWQWFYLSHIYHLVGRRDDAMLAVTTAIELRPTEQIYWGFQHYLNMLKAADQTGRPIEDFLPIPPGGDAEDIEGLFNFDDKIKNNNQNL